MKWTERGSSNEFKVRMGHGGRCWVTDPDSQNFEAGKAATRMAYGIEPDLTREGGSIPVTLTLQEATEKDVLLLPMGACDDGAHSQNEKINEKRADVLLGGLLEGQGDGDGSSLPRQVRLHPVRHPGGGFAGLKVFRVWVGHPTTAAVGHAHLALVGAPSLGPLLVQVVGHHFL